MLLAAEFGAGLLPPPRLRWGPSCPLPFLLSPPLFPSVPPFSPLGCLKGLLLGAFPGLLGWKRGFWKAPHLGFLCHPPGGGAPGGFGGGAGLGPKGFGCWGVECLGKEEGGPRGKSFPKCVRRAWVGCHGLFVRYFSGGDGGEELWCFSASARGLFFPRRTAASPPGPVRGRGREPR